jgi:hypothetical protein
MIILLRLFDYWGRTAKNTMRWSVDAESRIKDTIVFITINHHDAVYGETSAIYAQLEELYPELWDEPSAE